MTRGVREPRNKIVPMKSILGDIYPPDETDGLSGAIVFLQPSNEKKIHSFT
jgi:hypothetical protein